MGLAFAIGLGILLLSAGLILLQLKYFREGDRKKGGEPGEPPLPPVRPAPAELKSLRLRTIWKNMEETRCLMKRREEEAREREMQKEHGLLALSREEEILFMADSSLPSTWPLAVLSLVAIAVSTMLSPIPALLVLAAGLVGLLCLARLNRSTRCYITNFRVLVRTRSLLRGTLRWSVLHHGAVRRLSVEESCMWRNIRLEGRDDEVDIRGLSRERAEAASRILERFVRATSA